jgi:hypothetical protein
LLQAELAGEAQTAINGPLPRCPVGSAISGSGSDRSVASQLVPAGPRLEGWGGAGSTHLGWSRVGGAGRAGCRAGGEGGDLHQDGEVTSRANIVTKGTSRLKDSSLLSLNTLQYFRIDCYHQLVNHSTLLTCSSRWMPRIRTIRPCRAAQAQ